jgi:hypothetical protein
MLNKQLRISEKVIKRVRAFYPDQNDRSDKEFIEWVLWLFQPPVTLPNTENLDQADSPHEPTRLSDCESQTDDDDLEEEPTLDLDWDDD